MGDSSRNKAKGNGGQIPFGLNTFYFISYEKGLGRAQMLDRQKFKGLERIKLSIMTMTSLCIVYIYIQTVFYVLY